METCIKTTRQSYREPDNAPLEPVAALRKILAWRTLGDAPDNVNEFGYRLRQIEEIASAALDAATGREESYGVSTKRPK